MSAARGERVMMFDAIRVIAAVVVIYFHSIESETLRASGIIGRFSVAFYTMAAMVFLVRGLRRHPERGLAEYARGRFKRLYLPFLGWSVLTFAGMTLVHHFDRGTAVPAIELNSLVAGLAPQLWFIPFILVGGMVLFPLARLALGRGRREMLLASAAVLVAVGLDWLPWNDPPLQQWPLVGRMLELSWHRWSALYWGLALAIVVTRWMKVSKGKSRMGSAMAWGGLALVVATTAYQWVYGIHPGLKVMGGLGVCLVAFAPWKHVLISKLGKLAPLSFGMFMCHTLWISAARALANHYQLPTCWQRDVLVFGLAVAGSVVTVRVLGASAALGWLAGKEPSGEERARGGRGYPEVVAA